MSWLCKTLSRWMSLVGTDSMASQYTRAEELAEIASLERSLEEANKALKKIGNKFDDKDIMTNEYTASSEDKGPKAWCKEGLEDVYPFIEKIKNVKNGLESVYREIDSKDWRDHHKYRGRMFLMENSFRLLWGWFYEFRQQEREVKDIETKLRDKQIQLITTPNTNQSDRIAAFHGSSKKDFNRGADAIVSFPGEHSFAQTHFLDICRWFEFQFYQSYSWWTFWTCLPFVGSRSLTRTKSDQLRSLWPWMDRIDQGCGFTWDAPAHKLCVSPRWKCTWLR